LLGKLFPFSLKEGVHARENMTHGTEQVQKIKLLCRYTWHITEQYMGRATRSGLKQWLLIES
jgi:hypothetical protein